MVMGQNTSSTVMQQRKEPADSLDFFPTPPWATRALCEHVLRPISPVDLEQYRVWEPACGIGSMASPLGEYFKDVFASDVHDYGYGQHHDFLQPYLPFGIGGGSDWIITNPPFRIAQQFTERALSVARVGAAMLVRTAFLEGCSRFEFFHRRPPAIVAQFAERVPMVKGRLDRKASTATSYCWLVWKVWSDSAPRMIWIPPCRKQLERDSDYQPVGEVPA